MNRTEYQIWDQETRESSVSKEHLAQFRDISHDDICRFLDVMWQHQKQNAFHESYEIKDTVSRDDAQSLVSIAPITADVLSLWMALKFCSHRKRSRFQIIIILNLDIDRFQLTRPVPNWRGSTASNGHCKYIIESETTMIFLRRPCRS